MGVAEIAKRGANNMNEPQVRIVTAAEARRALTKGDIRSEVAFQNDINTLLARLEETKVPLLALAGPQPSRSR
jgi:hypothetical protein